MREILFRGKRIDNGEWVEGFYNHIPCGRFLCDEHCIQTIKQDGRIGQLYDVYDSTVEQFTGKTVKNGKVFDGDICKSIDGIFLVCWDEEKSAFVMRFLEYPFETLYLEEMWDDAEIIGNIHDNPELLEVE